jgi:hypothetical protein
MRLASQACAVSLALALVGAGCVGPMAPVDGGYRHRKHDFTIGSPDGSGGAWERVEVKGAALAFQRPGPQTLSLKSLCGKPVGNAQLMARHLRLGLADDWQVLASGPVDVDGRSGWSQTLATSRDGVPLHLKTVTLVAGGCTFDWILTSAGPFEAAEADFDRWWASFRLGSSYAGEAG